MDIEEIKARKEALKNTIASYEKNIKPLRKELEELKSIEIKMIKNKKEEKGNK